MRVTAGWKSNLAALCIWTLGNAQVTCAADTRAPALRIDTAVFDAGSGTLQYAFTFANPGDSEVFLDCQIPPHAALKAKVLSLRFDRVAADSAGAAAGGAAEKRADGPVEGAVDPEQYPPQRIAAHQTFQGQRRLDRVLGDPASRPDFSSLRIEMAWYPGHYGDEGPAFKVQEAALAAAPAKKVLRKGKPPAPQKPIRIRRPAE